MRTVACFAVLLIAFEALAQSEDAAVYDAVLRHYSEDFERRHKTPAVRLVFHESATVEKRSLGYQGSHLPKELMDALIAKNEKSVSIGDYVPPKPHRRVSEWDLGNAVSAGEKRRLYDWELLRKTFPDFQGTLELSIPAYSADGNEALVYFWTGCGMLCGEGLVYWLRKVDGSWQVHKTFMPWIA